MLSCFTRDKRLNDVSFSCKRILHSALQASAEGRFLMFRVILSLRPKLVAERAFLIFRNSLLLRPKLRNATELIASLRFFVPSISCGEFILCAKQQSSCPLVSFVLLYSCSVNSLLCLKTTLMIVKIISQ